ncbi:hypothetical protein [Rhizobium sp. RU36D]|uniref:hypothetical protein n=1 Tax=Rhizobium sp. RU36D TaxID=1907415 RepID=UPI0009D868EE|nr:hypothetical protein [Rhizobium sp. RU36D]SMD20594.1 hypothetical protein SAMN05880593_1572 [Rhizobium sp. RU36D]
MNRRDFLVGAGVGIGIISGMPPLLRAIKNRSGIEAKSSTSLADLNTSDLPFLFDQVDIRAHGAKVDARESLETEVSAGSKLLRSRDVIFSELDVGKTIAVFGAGSDGVAFVTKIDRVKSKHEVLLEAAALTSVHRTQATYGSDDTTAWQQAIDQAHRMGSTVVMPRGCSLLNGSVYIQTSRETGATSLIWKRLSIRGREYNRAPENGLLDLASSSVFKPTEGPIFCVNLDADGAGMTAKNGVMTHQFINFRCEQLNLKGAPGIKTTGIKGYSTRASLAKLGFHNLYRGWDFLDPDINGAENYCDMWDVSDIQFANMGDLLFQQSDADASIFSGLRCENFQPKPSAGIVLKGGRGWIIDAPLINKLPDSASEVIRTEYSSNGVVRGGHFERNMCTVVRFHEGNGCSFESNEIFVPDREILSNSIVLHGQFHRAAQNLIRLNRLSGADVLINGDSLEVGNSSQTAAGNPRPTVVHLGNSTGRQFRQPISFRLSFSSSGWSLYSARGNLITEFGTPTFDQNTGLLNLDGPMSWGKINSIQLTKIAGKYTPVLYSVQYAFIAFEDFSGKIQKIPSQLMECWVFIT